MRVPALILLMVVTLLSAAIARADDSAAINKLIADINTAARRNKARILRIIVINTDVAASTLEQEKSRTGLSYGDVYVAHSLAMASQKSLTNRGLKAKGQSWAKSPVHTFLCGSTPRSRNAKDNRAGFATAAGDRSLSPEVRKKSRRRRVGTAFSAWPGGICGDRDEQDVWESGGGGLRCRDGRAWPRQENIRNFFEEESGRYRAGPC